MASILKPASEALPLMMKMTPNAETCQPAAFLDCVWKLPKRERRGDRIFNSACATDSGCKPELMYVSGQDNKELFDTNDQIRTKTREVQRAFGKLGHSISRDFERARQQS